MNQGTEKKPGDETEARDETPAGGQEEHPSSPPPEAEQSEPAEPEAGTPEEENDPVADLEAQVAEHKDKLLRAMAEMENVRRRARREKEDAAKYSIANFAREMLQVGDNLRRAVESVDGEARKKDEALENLCIGVEMTERVMLNAFEQVGIRSIAAEGARFDHNLHEAMFEVEAPDQPAGTVVQVMRGGYMLHDRLLRPVQVGVSRGGPKAPAAGAPRNAAENTTENAAEDATEAQADAASAYEKPAKDAGANLDEEL